MTRSTRLNGERILVVALLDLEGTLVQSIDGNQEAVIDFRSAFEYIEGRGEIYSYAQQSH